MIFFIFTGTEQELLSLFDQMNRVHHTIKFTFHYSKTQVNFLDTLVILDSTGTLSTNLYTKPTDTFSLLHFESFHPLSTKKSIIFSQALRYRIITHDSDFMKALSHLEWILRCRKYPQELIHEQFEKVLSLTQREVLSRSRKEDIEENRKLIFSIPFSNSHHQISGILKEGWKNIERDPNLSRIWKNPPTVAIKRHSNLKDLLVHSRQQNN